MQINEIANEQEKVVNGCKKCWNVCAIEWKTVRWLRFATAFAASLLQIIYMAPKGMSPSERSRGERVGKKWLL
jgi:hypothetical protein